MASTRARRFPRQSEPEPGPQPEPDAESESEIDHGPNIQNAPKPALDGGGKYTTNANAEPANTPRPPSEHDSL